MNHNSRKSHHPDPGGWLPVAAGAGAYRPWLEEAGSLTARIVAHCPKGAAFSVRVLNHGNGYPERDELPVLGIADRQFARVREVLLLSGKIPVVFAHTVVARPDLRHPWLLMESVGGRALGSVLFTDPRIMRGPLYYRSLDARHPLYHRAAAWGNDPPGQFWARRAAFVLGGRPLLVTEVFLSAILTLKR